MSDARPGHIVSPDSPAGSTGKGVAQVTRPTVVGASERAALDPTAVVLGAAHVSRITDRIAHQIIESIARGGFDAVLLGIPTRGVPLAHRLAARIETFAGVALPVGSLDITLYRDDLRLRGVRPLGETAVPDGGVDGRIVILVDDVLCSGRSCRAALDALTELGRPQSVQLAALVDRGHRELPIRADYVGKNLPTSPGQNVRVLLEEVDDVDAVLVEDAEGAA